MLLPRYPFEIALCRNQPLNFMSKCCVSTPGLGRGESRAGKITAALALGPMKSQKMALENRAGGRM
jgi:hypothetical protein